MFSAILVLLFILGFAAQQYMKGGLVKAFILFISSLVALAVALGYYELLGGFAAGFLGEKAYVFTCALPFIFVMILIAELAKRILKESPDIEEMVDRAGGVVFGALTGLICAGMAFIIIGLVPYGATKLVYAPYKDTMSNPPQPAAALLKADKVAAGIFSYMSKSGFAGSTNFAVVNADFIDKLFLNHSFIETEKATGLRAKEDVVSVEAGGMIRAPEKLKKLVGEKTELVDPVSGQTLYIVTANINSASLEISEEGGQDVGFGQIRLVAVPKGMEVDSPGIAGTTIYSVGFINDKGLLETVKLSDMVKFAENSSEVKLAFYVPVDQEPAMIQVKLNGAAIVRAAPAKPAKPETPKTEDI